MISVRINGKEERFPDGIILTDYLKAAGFNPERIAVERNGEILPKSEYEKTLLADGDAFEVVQFVGGG